MPKPMQGKDETMTKPTGGSAVGMEGARQPECLEPSGHDRGGAGGGKSPKKKMREGGY